MIQPNKSDVNVRKLGGGGNNGAAENVRLSLYTERIQEYGNLETKATDVGHV